jgi:hypothetical protein
MGQVPHYKKRGLRDYLMALSKCRTLIYDSKSLKLSSDCDEAA